MNSLPFFYLCGSIKYKKLKRLKKKVYLGLVYIIIAVLAVIRCARPDLAQTLPDRGVAGDSIEISGKDETVFVSESEDSNGANEEWLPVTNTRNAGVVTVGKVPRFRDNSGEPIKNRIYSVPSFRRTFPDLQDVQIEAARQWGVEPVEDRAEAEQRKDELVYVGSNPYYTMDGRMSYSIPYLVPRASNLLQKISRNFLDSLAIKGIPLHTLIVTSVLRTESDVRRLRAINGNASPESCHRYGTTFDICYNRYNTVQHPDGPERRAVGNDTLKWVLSEVLRDMREAEMCYIKYEVRQGCFHITVR